ncbi:hypothetical protein P4261_16175 [Bacillus thuringiensis]|nr:hypothetical protein [Bacillus thuringiensis]MED2810039.1 hypothetical protein [Bacillus thuringiensis]MED2827181.1 hypothetical protein [Bacillus thuringiensis]MED2832899.1 hypothetical protein [Bacillus thuringiensis]MED2851105.1 hypothetical protein [Bacillus thuringiensis]
MDDFLKQFTAVHRYCLAEGFEGGFLSGDSTNSEFYWKIGIMKIHKNSESIIPKDIEETDNFRLTTVEDMFMKANNLPEIGNDFIGAIPTFEQGTHNGKIYNGVIFIRENAADLITVPVLKLKEYAQDVTTSAKSRFFAVNRYLHDQGTYPGGFPTFSEGPSLNDESLINLIAFKENYCSHEGISDLNFYSQFYEYHNFVWDDEFYIRKAFNEVIRAFPDSPFLNMDEKKNLRDIAIKSKLLIYPETNPTLNGTASGNKITLNLNNFRDKDTGFLEMCRTTIHELMHISGYEHPNKLESFQAYAGCGCTGQTVGIPQDALDYWTSVPLKAECTFANTQTDHI